jgi:hypothetical protein
VILFYYRKTGKQTQEEAPAEEPSGANIPDGGQSPGVDSTESTTDGAASPATSEEGSQTSDVDQTSDAAALPVQDDNTDGSVQEAGLPQRSSIGWAAGGAVAASLLAARRRQKNAAEVTAAISQSTAGFGKLDRLRRKIVRRK